MPIEKLDPQNSILFLGSGFSAGSTNISNEKLPTGRPLLKKLANALGEDAADLDLKSAADEFITRDDISLYDLLYQTFTVREVLDYQRDILCLPWARIYTTNYDDIIHFVKGANFEVFSFDQERPRTLPKSFAVHLHGSIRKITEESVDRDLVLNSQSYDSIVRNHQDWFYEFQRDRRNFDSCIFMGFSLGDHHIAGLMTSGEESVKKTYFIVRDNVNQAFVKRASEYGEVAPIGFDGFSKLLKSLPLPERPANLNSLNSFKLLRPGIDSKALADPTEIEIINLVTFGTFSQTRYFNTKGKSDYVSSRSNNANLAIEKIYSHKTVIVHSRLGNGKTIFCSVLAREASEKGFKCLQWRRSSHRLSQELDLIATEQRPLIIFDDYDAAVENISRISSSVPHAKFIVTVRTGQQEVRLHEVYEKIPAPIYRINIDIFSDADKEEFLAILDNAGAHADGLHEVMRGSREVRDIVTRLYNHAEIRGKINAIVAALPASMAYIITVASLIKWVGVEVDDTYIQDLADCDVYAEIRKSGLLSIDLLRVSDDKVEMRSSILSEYLIQRIIDPSLVLGACFDVVTSATRRRNDRSYRRLSGELMKFSTLQRFFKFNPNVDLSLEKHFNKLANDISVNAEPLFWLQYAILMKKSGNILNARLFLNTGYERAGRMPGFKVFQLDTQALSIYMLQEMENTATTVDMFDEITNAIRKITNMVEEQSHRYYAIDVLGEIPAFIEARGLFLKEAEKILIVFELNRAIRILSSLSENDKAISGSEAVRVALNGSVSHLLRLPQKSE